MGEEIERYQAKVHFQHTFKRIKQQMGFFGISSPNFFARNIPFYVNLHKRNGHKGGICCDLRCGVELTGGRVLNVEYKLTLINSSKRMESAEFPCSFNSENFAIRTTLRGEIFKDNAITVGVSLWVEEPAGLTGYKPPKEKLLQRLQIAENRVQNEAFLSLLDSGDFSDVSFVVSEDSSRVKAHKTILAARSQVFARMLSTEMKEAKDNEIRIYDMGPPALKIMLRYIYSGQLRFPKGFKVDLKICQELANAGEKYDLENLKEYAAMAMTEFVSLENAWELLMFAKRLKAEAATQALTSYWGLNVYKIIEKA